MMCLGASHKKKIWGKNRVLVRDMDPGIRIRTKMSRIPNTGYNFHNVKLRADF